MSICNGVYVDTGDKMFEAETSYYLQFQIEEISDCHYY